MRDAHQDTRLVDLSSRTCAPQHRQMARAAARARGSPPSTSWADVQGRAARALNLRPCRPATLLTADLTVSHLRRLSRSRQRPSTRSYTRRSSSSLKSENDSGLPCGAPGPCSWTRPRHYFSHLATRSRVKFSHICDMCAGGPLADSAPDQQVATPSQQAASLRWPALHAGEPVCTPRTHTALQPVEARWHALTDLRASRRRPQGVLVGAPGTSRGSARG